MSEVVRLALRLTPELHQAVKAQALREGRSLHGQIVYVLRRSLEREHRPAQQQQPAQTAQEAE